jgi:predicted nucleotidyltransferase
MAQEWLQSLSPHRRRIVSTLTDEPSLKTLRAMHSMRLKWGPSLFVSEADILKTTITGIDDQRPTRHSARFPRPKSHLPMILRVPEPHLCEPSSPRLLRAGAALERRVRLCDHRASLDTLTLAADAAASSDDFGALLRDILLVSGGAAFSEPCLSVEDPWRREITPDFPKWFRQRFFFSIYHFIAALLERAMSRAFLDHSARAKAFRSIERSREDVAAVILKFDFVALWSALGAEERARLFASEFRAAIGEWARGGERRLRFLRASVDDLSLDRSLIDSSDGDFVEHAAFTPLRRTYCGYDRFVRRLLRRLQSASLRASDPPPPRRGRGPREIDLPGAPPFSAAASALMTRLLTQEVEDFVASVAPTPLERERREAAVRLVRSAAARVWGGGGCRCDVFGSYATGLLLPHSDIDLVCALTRAPPAAAVAALTKELSSVCYPPAWLTPPQMPWCASCKAIESASIPLVKCDIRPELSPPYAHLRGPTPPVACDVSFADAAALASGTAPHVGVRVRDFVLEALAAYPIVRPLNLVLKKMLHVHNLNVAYRGGVSSYLLFLLVLAHVKLCGVQPLPRGARPRERVLPSGAFLPSLLHFLACAAHRRIAFASDGSVVVAAYTPKPGEAPLYVDDPVGGGGGGLFLTR